MWRVVQWVSWLFTGLTALGIGWAYVLANLVPERALDCYWASQLFASVECQPGAFLGPRREIVGNLWFTLLLPLFTLPRLVEGEVVPEFLMATALGLLAWGAVAVTAFTLLRWLYAFTLRR